AAATAAADLRSPGSSLAPIRSARASHGLAMFAMSFGEPRAAATTVMWRGAVPPVETPLRRATRTRSCGERLTPTRSCGERLTLTRWCGERWRRTPWCGAPHATIPRAYPSFGATTDEHGSSGSTGSPRNPRDGDRDGFCRGRLSVGRPGLAPLAAGGEAVYRGCHGLRLQPVCAAIPANLSPSSVVWHSRPHIVSDLGVEGQSADHPRERLDPVHVVCRQPHVPPGAW